MRSRRRSFSRLNSEVVMGLTASELARKTALHALNRLGFGPRPGDVEARPGPWDRELHQRSARSGARPRPRGPPRPPEQHPATLHHPGPGRLRRLGEPDLLDSGVSGQPAHRQADPVGPLQEPARGGARRLLVQPLQRQHQRQLRPLLHPVLRARRHPSERDGEVRDPAEGHRRASGHALLPRQLPLPGLAGP